MYVGLRWFGWERFSPHAMRIHTASSECFLILTDTWNPKKHIQVFQCVNYATAVCRRCLHLKWMFNLRVSQAPWGGIWIVPWIVSALRTEHHLKNKEFQHIKMGHVSSLHIQPQKPLWLEGNMYGAIINEEEWWPFSNIVGNMMNECYMRQEDMLLS